MVVLLPSERGIPDRGIALVLFDRFGLAFSADGNARKGGRDFQWPENHRLQLDPQGLRRGGEAGGHRRGPGLFPGRSQDAPAPGSSWSITITVWFFLDTIPILDCVMSTVSSRPSVGPIDSSSREDISIGLFLFSATLAFRRLPWLSQPHDLGLQPHR